MLKPTYAKVILRDDKLTVVAVDYAERHELVRVTHPLLAQPILMAAYMTPTRQAWKAAIEGLAGNLIYGQAVRAPEVEEAFMACDRTQYPALPTLFFPDAQDEYRWSTWTSTPDAEDPADVAWGVDLDDGYAFRLHQSFHGLVRAVVSGQYSDLGVVEA